MFRLLINADGLLRASAAAASATSVRRNHLRLLGFILVCGVGYGAVMGTFGGVSGGRFLQIVYSASKVPFLLLATFVISLPSFFVLNTLLGVRADFGQVLEGLASTQAVLTILLLALAPYTALWYVSSADYQAAVLFNGLMFAVASFAAQWFLHRLYQPLIARNARHRLLLRVWLLIYVFVGIQMGWVLRPFVGQPNIPVQFFRQEAWGNAYVEVSKKIWDVISQMF